MNKEPSDILVSVSVITYQHAPYIKECLESILNQKTNFDFEILIHDDASTDGSTQIIEEYKALYPNMIFPKIQKENQYSKGIRGINFRYNFPRARGKYIALCEGDDYWVDEYKLQKQVDFLEAHPECSGIASNTQILYEQNPSQNRLFKQIPTQMLGTQDLVGMRKFHTATLMGRTELLQKMNYPEQVLSGDRFMNLALSLEGDIMYLDEVMAVYRDSGKGVSASTTSQKMMKDLSIGKSLKKNYPITPYASIQYHTTEMILRYSQTISFWNFIQLGVLLFGYGWQKNIKKPHTWYRLSKENLQLIRRILSKVHFFS